MQLASRCLSRLLNNLAFHPKQTSVTTDHMKKTILFAAVIGLSLAQAPAATIVTGDTTNGFVDSANTQVAGGAVRYGTWASGFDFASNANDLAALDAAFIEVVSYTGPFNAFGVTGVFDKNNLGANLDYDPGATFEGTPYDLSAGTTADVGGDIAGELVYAWILNNAVTASATEHAVISSGQTWTDGDTPANNDTSYSWATTDGAGVTAHIGTLLGGPNIGGAANAHQLAQVPEPSRAVLGFLGLGALFFRRRR